MLHKDIKLCFAGIAWRDRHSSRFAAHDLGQARALTTRAIFNDATRAAYVLHCIRNLLTLPVGRAHVSAFVSETK